MNTLSGKISAWVAGVSAFVAWLVSLPPENQDAIIKPLIELTPLDWRPSIGLATRFLATVSTIYMFYKTHPKPPTP